MPTSAARAADETEQRIYSLSVWRECPFYTEGERVVMELTEALTQVALSSVPDGLYQRVREHFSTSNIWSHSS